MDKQREAFDKWLRQYHADHFGEESTVEDYSWDVWQAAQQAKWLPIESNLPSCKESAIEYLVFDTLNNKVGHDYWMVPDDGGEPFWNHYGEYVSHWMPLPPEPQP
jgi:hypothetical protein